LSVDKRVVGLQVNGRSIRESPGNMRVVDRQESCRSTRGPLVDTGVVGRHERRRPIRAASDGRPVGRHENHRSTRASSVNTSVVGRATRRSTREPSVDTRSVGRREGRLSAWDVDRYACRRSIRKSSVDSGVSGLRAMCRSTQEPSVDTALVGRPENCQSIHESPIS
jgi:hypothetical protein